MGEISANHQILLPDAPEIPGLAFRGFRGEPDYPLMLEVINVSKDVDGIERSDSLEEIQRSYQHLHNCDPYTDMVFAEVYGEVVGYSRVWWEQEEDGDWIGTHIGFLSPIWRGKGIGSTMSSFNEERIKEIVTSLMEEDQLPVSMTCCYQVYADDTEIEKIHLLESLGYKPVRYEHYMKRLLGKEIRVIPMPNGLEVRSVQDEEIHTIIAAADEAFQDH
jgi:GNAT superfamily N-acetyltransferase